MDKSETPTKPDPGDAHIKTIKKRQDPAVGEYKAKRRDAGIDSFNDFYGRTYTYCHECTDAECKARDDDGNGCMAGTIKPELEEFL